jgi:hypothetical protein
VKWGTDCWWWVAIAAYFAVIVLWLLFEPGM